MAWVFEPTPVHWFSWLHRGLAILTLVAGVTLFVPFVFGITVAIPAWWLARSTKLG